MKIKKSLRIGIPRDVRIGGLSLSSFHKCYKVYKKKRQKMEIESKNTDFDMIQYFHSMN